MKNLKILLVVFFTVISFSMFAQLPDPLIWLKMNELNADSTVTNYGDSVVNVYAQAKLPTIVNDSVKGDVMQFVKGSELTVDNKIYHGVKGNTPRTYMTWIKMENDYPGNFIIHKAGAKATTPGHTFFHVQVIDTLLKCYFGKDSKMGVFGYYPNTFDKWHHIAYSYENDSICVMVDGEMSAEKMYCDGGLNTELVWVRLFADFIGSACDYRVYDKALTEAQIQEIIAPEATSLNEVEDEDVKIYVSGYQMNVTSDISFVKVELYNLTGTSLMSRQLQNNSVNLSNFKEGLYITVLTSKTGKRYSQKIMVN